MRIWSVILTILAFAALATPGPAQEQAPVSSPILTIESERLFLESAFGIRVVSELETLGAALSSENRQIEAELAAEEKNLTTRRSAMEPEDFRVLADAFDEKVQAIRRNQESKSRELNQRLEQQRLSFLNAAAPVLEQLMREFGATVVLERRAVFISANAIDITDAAIERLNNRLGDENRLEHREAQ